MFGDLPEKIDLCEIDDFVASTAQDCLQCKKAEVLHLLNSDGGRHGQFLATHGNFDERRPFVSVLSVCC